MKYDFTSIMDRRGRDALAIDSVGHGHAPGAPREGFDVIPMWIADMNFPTIPTVPAAIIERAKHPVYGYFFPSDAYFNAIFRWQEQRHGVTGLTRENIGYENGVLGGVVSALNVFCSKGGNVLLHSPTYTGFTGALGNNGYNMILSPLVKDENGVWRMDFEDMERRIVENHIHAAVFCSPHNPTGRVWERWEVERFTELCAKHDVFIVSDEIWSDIVRPGVVHTPTQSVSEDAKNRTLALYAPSKTFNLAGLVGSYHIAYSPWIRDRMEKECSLSHYDSMNVLSMHALIAAYSPEGSEWADELCAVLAGNIDFACNYIKTRFDGVEVTKPEGTYILFADCTKWCEAHGKTIDDVERACWDVGVAVQDGRQFHGPCHIRMNLACPRATVDRAVDAMVRAMGPAAKPGTPRVQLGDTLPDAAVDTPFEAGLPLSQVVGGKPTMLVFLRYSGCPLCQLDMHELAAGYDAIRAAGGQAVVVLQSDPQKLAGELGGPAALPYTILCDPEKKLYERLAVWPAASQMELMGPGLMEKMAQVEARGIRHGDYEGDEMQLPAAFAVDGQLRVTWAHYGQGLADTPTPAEIAARLKA